MQEDFRGLTMRSDPARRDWLAIGLSLVALAVVVMAVEKTIDFTANASPAAITHVAE